MTKFVHQISFQIKYQPENLLDYQFTACWWNFKSIQFSDFKLWDIEDGSIKVMLHTYIAMLKLSLAMDF